MEKCNSQLSCSLLLSKCLPIKRLLKPSTKDWWPSAHFWWPAVGISPKAWTAHFLCFWFCSHSPLHDTFLPIHYFWSRLQKQQQLRFIFTLIFFRVRWHWINLRTRGYHEKVWREMNLWLLRTELIQLTTGPLKLYGWSLKQTLVLDLQTFIRRRTTEQPLTFRPYYKSESYTAGVRIRASVRERKRGREKERERAWRKRAKAKERENKR